MFQQVTKHIYIYPYHDGYTSSPNIALIVGEKHTLLFDAGMSQSHARLMQRELAQQGLPLPDFCCLSHWHWDHSFAAHAWDCCILAGRETNEHLKRMQTWKWDDASIADRIASREDILLCCEMIKREYPTREIHVACADIVFDSHMTLDLGSGVVCELIGCNAPHSSDCVICHVPGDRFALLSDSGNKDLYTTPWEFDINHTEDFEKNTACIAYDRQKLSEYLHLLDALDFTHCIGGHADMQSKAALIASLRAYL